MPDWTIRADFGSGLVTIDTQHVQKINRQRRLHKELKVSIDTCTLEITEESLALSFQTTEVDIPIEIDRDGSAYFRGIVRPNHTRRFNSRLTRMQIEAVDYHYNLQTKITSDFSFSNLPISDPTDTANSFLHQVFARAGIDSGKLTFSAVTDEITEIAIGDSDDMTYWELLLSVLWEFGYVTYQLDNGNFEVYNLYPSSISFGTLTDDTPIWHGARERRREYRYQKVRVNYHPIVTRSDVVLWSDTTNQDDANRCNITLSAGEYYPGGCDSSPSYARYKLRDYEVIRGENLSLISSLSGVTVNTFDAGARRAEICLYSSGGGTITQLDIKGDAVLRDTTQTYRAVRIITAGSDQILEHQSKWLDTEAKANRLASGLADWYTDAIYTYLLETDADVNRGEYYTLDSDTMGISVDCRVVSDSEDQWGTRKLMLEAIAPVTITSDASEADFQPAENEPENQNTQSTVQTPSFNNLENGEKDDGTNLYVAGTVITGKGIKSDNYVSGSQGWAIDGAGDAEFNNATIRGTIYADAGEIGGWSITASTIEDTAGTVKLNNASTAFEILDAGSNYKIILGYMGNAPAGWTGPDGEQLTSTDYGLYVSGGDFTVADGAQFENGNYFINSDAAYKVRSTEGEEIIVLGSLGGGDIGLDIGGVRFATALTGGGNSANTMGSTVTGGGGASTVMAAGLVGGGGSLYGNEGLLYSLEDNRLIMSGSAIIDDTLSAAAIKAEGLIESAFSPGNNYWDLSTGDWRIGDADSYIEFDASLSELTLNLDAIYVSSLETNVSGDIAISSETGVSPQNVRTNSQPIEIGTEDADDPTYGYINHADSVILQTGGNDRLTIDSSGVFNPSSDTQFGGQVGIGTAPSYKLDVSGNSYISGNLGVGVYNSSYKLYVDGDSYISNSLEANTITVNGGTGGKATVDVNGDIETNDFISTTAHVRSSNGYRNSVTTSGNNVVVFQHFAWNSGTEENTIYDNLSPYVGARTATIGRYGNDPVVSVAESVGVIYFYDYDGTQVYSAANGDNSTLPVDLMVGLLHDNI